MTSIDLKNLNSEYIVALFLSILLFIVYFLFSYLNEITTLIFALIAIILIIWTSNIKKKNNLFILVICLVLILFIYMSFDFILINYAY